MLHIIQQSRSTKTAGCAVTYRAGKGDRFGTCPKTCTLNPSRSGAEKIDQEYLDAVLNAVPRRGVAFTYSHFDWKGWASKLEEGKTVINFSADSPLKAAGAIKAGVPAVTVVSSDYWQGRRNQSAPFGVKMIRCPAELKKGFTCSDCGNGRPLCARLDRDFIVGFTAHGPNKKKAATPNDPGGCYADAGNCRIWWNRLANDTEQEETDAEKVTRFAKGLPPGSILRHHVAGDIGSE